MHDPARMQEQLYTVEEYLALDAAVGDARYEYVGGRIAMLAGATRAHVTITGNLYARLHRLTEAGYCGVYQSDLRLRVSEDQYYYPDVMVACIPESSGDPMEETAPVVIVEVLSETTTASDFGVKLAAYLGIPSLRMYLIVAQDERRVEVHSRRREGEPWSHRIATAKDTIAIQALDGSITLDEIYARTTV
jgi:Uma2 family endonuclease